MVHAIIEMVDTEILEIKLFLTKEKAQAHYKRSALEIQSTFDEDDECRPTDDELNIACETLNDLVMEDYTIMHVEVDDPE